MVGVLVCIGDLSRVRSFNKNGGAGGSNKETLTRRDPFVVERVDTRLIDLSYSAKEGQVTK